LKPEQLVSHISTQTTIIIVVDPALHVLGASAVFLVDPDTPKLATFRGGPQGIDRIPALIGHVRQEKIPRRRDSSLDV